MHVFFDICSLIDSPYFLIFFVEMKNQEVGQRLFVMLELNLDYFMINSKSQITVGSISESPRSYILKIYYACYTVELQIRPESTPKRLTQELTSPLAQRTRLPSHWHKDDTASNPPHISTGPPAVFPKQEFVQAVAPIKLVGILHFSVT
jgi:hypothetical protein